MNEVEYFLNLCKILIISIVLEFLIFAALYCMTSSKMATTLKIQIRVKQMYSLDSTRKNMCKTGFVFFQYNIFSLRYTGSKIVEPLVSRPFYVTLNGYISMKKCRIEKSKPSFTHNFSSII